jgi:hypothetical protein
MLLCFLIALFLYAGMINGSAFNPRRFSDLGYRRWLDIGIITLRK